MKRSVRSGIAIAGMAGGFWLLGQTVANAEEAPPPTTAAADAAQTSTTTGGSGGSGGGDADSSNRQSVDASNDVENDATAGDVTAKGGTSAVGVVAGNANTLDASSGEGDVKATQNVTTVVWISSEATGATVSNSGNASAGDNASANATATGTQNSSTTGGSGRSGGDADSNNRQHVDASNDIDNDARGGDIYAGGGKSLVGVIAGNDNLLVASSDHHGGPAMGTLSREGGNKGWWNHHDSGDVDATQNVHTTVGVHSTATGATVTNSGNASAGDNAHYNAHATGTQNSQTTGGNGRENWDGHHGNKHWWNHHHGGGDADSNNNQHVDSSNDVDNEATGGDINAGGGTSVVGVIAGNGNTLYCTSHTGNVTCSQNITTIINIVSQAGGATVSCSGNASAGSTGSAVCPVTHNSTKPTEAAPAAAAAHKAAAPAAHRAPVNTKAQPAGQLAFTGAETSAPLTLGLIALGAGGALTFAGRRRSATAAV